MTVTLDCLDSRNQVKKRYATAAAARHDLKRSARWRRRATWPQAYLCRCGWFHVGRHA